MTSFLARFFLMSGNIAVGLAVLAPAGMLGELAEGLHVGIHDAGLLVTYGAVVLCIGSPVMAWLTTRIDRRLLLVATLSAIALGQGASALAPNYATVLALRLAMLAIAAIYTPQAAATVGLIVAEKERPSAIAFVFLGWSLAIAAGLPLITWLATTIGWRMATPCSAAARRSSRCSSSRRCQAASPASRSLSRASGSSRATNGSCQFWPSRCCRPAASSRCSSISRRSCAA
jgi:predicted MFS family arabinose efflux permease